MHPLPTQIDTVVIGGGQAGLATSYHLSKRGVGHVVLDENNRAGAAWRKRWDSLRLFTPGRFSSLPDMEAPCPAKQRPTKDEMADALESYAHKHDLPLRGGVHVDLLTASATGWAVHTNGSRLHATSVVVATGAFHHPRIPDVADQLDPTIVQLHSSQYRRPSQIPDGPVLVVGAGASGSEVAIDLADIGQEVILSGRVPGEEPPVPDAVLWFVANHVLTMRNPIARRLRAKLFDEGHGIPVPHGTRRRLRHAGVKRGGRTVSSVNGRPQLDDGRVLDVGSVIWCTGFRPDFRWIDADLLGANEYPEHTAGVADSHPGLYFIGLPLQTRVASSLVGGVGRDAAHIAAHIAARSRQVWSSDAPRVG